MSRPLKIWNGRGHGNYDRGHFFICAHTKKDAAIMLDIASSRYKKTEEQVSKLDIGRGVRELSGYYAEGCWGNQMNGIARERGLWAVTSFFGTPVKII